MKESIMHRLADQAEAKLAPQEVAFVKAMLEGYRIDDAMAEFGLTESAAALVLTRAIDYIRSYANGLTGTAPPGASPTTASAESDLETILLAVDRLPRRALAGLAARNVRRLLPFAAVFAHTLPVGEEQFQAVEAALQIVERFSGGEAIPSGFADLARVVEHLRNATGGLGKGHREVRAYVCLENACATFSFVLGSEGEDRLGLSLAFKGSYFELPFLTDLAKSNAADARRLLNSSIDLTEGLSKLGDTPGVHPLGLLWPEGEPDWYRQEVAWMSKTTEAHSSPVPEPEVIAGDESSANNATSVGVQISPLAFLRSMAVLLWTAFRYPFRTTEVDLSTGRVVRQY